MKIKKAFQSSVIAEDNNWSSFQEKLHANSVTGAIGGFLVVINLNSEVVGTITDGDVRKYARKSSKSMNDVVAKDIMNRDFIHVSVGMTPSEMGYQVISQLQKRDVKNEFPITYIPVLKEDKTLSAIIHISNLLGILDELTRQIVVFGQGFVGLTMAMAMVKSGLTIHAFERNPESHQAIMNLKPKVNEPQLDELLSKYRNVRYFLHEKGLEDLARFPLMGRRTYIIAVGTPKLGFSVDLSQIENAVEEISTFLRFGDLVIIRSTVPIGTTRKLSEKFRDSSGLQAGFDFHIAYAPERTVEGDAIAEVTKLPQLVAGLTEECSKLAANFFSGWISNVIRMESLEACEMAKLMSNAYRDTTFAFSNEMALIASKHNLDINKIILNANAGYLRNTIPMPSPGVGGPCLTKDSYMLTTTSDLSMVLESRKINESMINFSILRILDLIKKHGDCVLVIGLAFKGFPATNDLRNSTAVEIATGIREISKEVKVIDAVANETEIVNEGFNIYEVGRFNPNVICILNNHRENKQILRSILSKKRYDSQVSFGIFDPWNMIDESDLQGHKASISTLSKYREYE